MYVIEALRSVLPGIGEASVAMLRAPGVNLVDEALPTLVNELADVSEQLVLVLDDYHAIEDERIHEGMASLIEHLPATLRIVMTSRVEPPLRVGTLRARAQLNEIDAVQLRFSLSEAESMLNDVHGLGLSPRRSSACTTAPRAGQPASIWPFCRCAGERMRAASSRPSPVAIDGSSTISQLRCSVSSVRRSWTFCFTRACSTGSVRLCATPSRARETAGRCLTGSSASITS